MEIVFYLCLAVAILLATAFFLFKLFKKPKGGDEKKIPETYFGAIRVTDREGRNMLIVRKDDGSFDMVEEEKIKK